MILDKPIYYLTDDLRQYIEQEWELMQAQSWYQLFKDPISGHYWRATVLDKYQVGFVVRVPDGVSWEEFDTKELEIALLEQHRGESAHTCIWQQCHQNALNGLVFCAHHAYNEMNIRK